LQAEQRTTAAALEAARADANAARKAQSLTSAEETRVSEALAVQERLTKVAEARAAAAEVAVAAEQGVRAQLQGDAERLEVALHAETEAAAALALQHKARACQHSVGLSHACCLALSGWSCSSARRVTASTTL
jgi:hypothetical protein